MNTLVSEAKLLENLFEACTGLTMQQQLLFAGNIFPTKATGHFTFYDRWT